MATRGRRRNGGGSYRRDHDPTSNDNARDNQRGRRNGGQRGNADSRATSETPSGAQRRGSTPNLFGASPEGAQGSTAGDVRSRLERIRALRPKLRQQFIRDGRMNPDGQMRLEDAVKLIGICKEMCPEFERVRRIVENDVKAPECTPETEHLPRSQRIPDESRMVKAYARSAAGVDVELVSELRSPATCLSTINYLFERLDNDDFEYLQNWIWDRTRSVRKDLRTQSITSRADIKIYLTCLERITRFHLISMHQMARSKREDYDHQQDLEQLNQTVMSLKERYADNRRAGIPSDNEAEFWALRLILAPQYVTNHLEYEVHGLPSDIRNNGRVKVAMEIYRLLQSVLITGGNDYIPCQANWTKLWELIKSPRVSYVMACAAEVSFNRVRHVVLDSLWRSYRVGNASHVIVIDSWTTDKLKDALGLDTDQEAVKLCEDFGFQFSVNKDGKTFLDLTKKGYSHDKLPRPLDVKSQTFSAKMVEIKRCDRAFSSIVHGMSVKEAKADGFIMDTEQEEEREDETTLFVPEKSTVKSSIGNQQPNGVSVTPTGQTAKTPLNPFAPAFQSSNIPATASNPFLKAAAELAKQPQSASGPLASDIQPGLFDASKNKIQFASLGNSANTGISASSNFPPPSTNPFLKAANTPSTAAESIFTTAPLAAQSSPFASTSSIADVNPFAKFATAKTKQAEATAAPPSTSPFVFPPQQPGATATPTSDPRFAFTPLKKPGDETPQRATQPESSFTPTGPSPQDATAANEAARQAAEQEKQKAAEKEKQEADARQRVLDAQRARAVQEAELRRNEEQKKRDEAEAAQRRQQLHADQERRAREEREQMIRQEQQRQAQKEEARMTQQRERNSAYQALTNDIMFDPEQGLLAQFFENATINMAVEAQEVVRREKREEEEAELRRQRGLILARAALVRWVGVIQKRKRAEETRNRRRRIKEQRRLASTEQTTVHAIASSQVPIVMTQSDDLKSTAPFNSRRARRTEERRGNPTSSMSRATQTISHEERSVHSATQTALVPTRPNNMNLPPATGYTQAYQQSTAPTDRTETDWFELRAMGIDPSKHRKRSFTYDSPSSEEERPQIESKRPRLSPALDDTENDDRLPRQPAFTTEDDQVARLRVVKKAFRTSGSTHELADAHASINGEPSASLNQAANRVSSTDLWPSVHKRSSSIIAKARAVLAKSSTTQHSSPSAQHDWGRSVPNLGLTASVSSGSVFGRSIGAAMKNDRPAYWGRTSKFVPRDLYGKGTTAIQAYYDEHINKSVSGSARSMSADLPAELSAIPTQQSYLPQSGFPQGGFFQPHFNEQEPARNTDPLTEFMTSEPTYPDIGNQFFPEHQVGSEHTYENHNGGGGYPQQFAQPQEYGNEDSALADTEEEEVEQEGEEGYEEGSGDEFDDDDHGPVQHGQGYVHLQEENEDDEYDEYSDEEEEEEEQDSAPPVRGQFLQPVPQRFAQHPQAATPAVKQQFVQAGTEDDAIELSD